MDALSACTEALKATGGYAPSVLPAVAHLQNVVLPALCVLCQRWSSLLPGAKKKKGEADAEAAAAPETASGARGAMRSALDAVLAALATLQTELKAAGARSAACTRLESEAADWEAFLGGGRADGGRGVPCRARRRGRLQLRVAQRVRQPPARVRRRAQGDRAMSS